MSRRIYYYTGTGNSLWVARLLAAELPGSELVHMFTDRSITPPGKPASVEPAPGAAPPAQKDSPGEDAVGLVFPVHMWGIPLRVELFARHLAEEGCHYVFAVAINAGQVVRSLMRLDRILRKKPAQSGVRDRTGLAVGFSVCMPSNYTPFGGPGSAEEQEQLFAAARAKVRHIGAAVRGGEHLPPEKSSVCENVVFTPLNRLLAPLAPRMDRFFRADETCNGCGICARICPARNIRLEQSRPVWLNHCEQCWACFHWCPEEAIQYGRLTRGRQRYHHPEIELEEMNPRREEISSG